MVTSTSTSKPGGILQAIAGAITWRGAWKPWAALSSAYWLRPNRRRQRLALQALLALLLVPSVGLLPPNTAGYATPLTTSLAPCPASAPLKRFDVQAVDVDITLNRFGDHDPQGKMYVLAEQVPAVRNQEKGQGIWARRPQKVSIGLRDDPIQPLVIRANLGDCVEIAFVNKASGGDYGLQVVGLAFEAIPAPALPDATAVPDRPGAVRTYRAWIPNDVALEGAHYLRPGTGHRAAISHGLFGALVVEPAGSTYLDPKTGQPLSSGWEAVIIPGSGPAFRESVQLFHEIGIEDETVLDAGGNPLPRVDPQTESDRPGARAINYRSEPYLHRLERAPEQLLGGPSSYAFGDPATPMPRAYVGDPTTIRVVHGGSEALHLYHLHGGIRWPGNRPAGSTRDQAGTGVQGQPGTTQPVAARRDSQALQPGQAFDLVIEGGAGGLQQAPGDFLYRCQLASHDASGQWSFWRVFNTLQRDLKPLPDRLDTPAAVDSVGLIGRTMPDGTVIARQNLDAWIRPQLPPPGVPQSDRDASVWNWTIEQTNPNAPIYLGEPEDPGPWPNLPNLAPSHPGSYLGDQIVRGRPKILFNPLDGRLAYPLLRPHIGKRPPFAPRGHSDRPSPGVPADQRAIGHVDPLEHWSSNVAAAVNGGPAASSSLATAVNGGPAARCVGPAVHGGIPCAGLGTEVLTRRSDGICPAGSDVRRFDVVAVPVPIQVDRKGAIDPNGLTYVLASDKADVLAGRKSAELLAIRGNVGDCVSLTLTSEQSDAAAFGGSARASLHVHGLRRDVQTSDGANGGLAYEQAVRPYRSEDPTLTAPAEVGASLLVLSSVAKFQPGVSIGVGLGTEGIEFRQILAVDAGQSAVTLDRSLDSAHAAGEWAGVEFVQYRWHLDAPLDNVVFHDQVDGAHTWRQGLVGQLIVEPAGSTYHDPKTGAPVQAGALVDVRTASPLVPGQVESSFRELVLWAVDGPPAADSTPERRAQPLAERPDKNSPVQPVNSKSAVESARPLPQAYAGDAFVIRAAAIGPTAAPLGLEGHRLLPHSVGEPAGTGRDLGQPGFSGGSTLILEGGAGGLRRTAGEYRYGYGPSKQPQPGHESQGAAVGAYSSTLVAQAVPQPGPGAGSGGADHRTGVQQYAPGSDHSYEGLLRVLPDRVPDLQPLMRPTTLPAPRVAAMTSGRTLAMGDYPRPRADNGRGMHWVPTTGSSKQVVDRFVAEAAAMKVRWITFLNNGAYIGDNDYLVQQLTRHGIMPVMRIYTPKVEPISGDLSRLVRHYRALGVPYYQIYNEPNLTAENGGSRPDVNRFASHWIPAARTVAAAGGLPGLAGLAPGGDFDDLAFLKATVDEIVRRGAVDVLDRAWVSLHNYTLNHPIDYLKDSNGYLKFRWYDAVIRGRLGRSLPIIGTEGGTYVGQQEDRTFPAIDEPRQIQMVLDSYRYLRQAEPYYFAYSFWIIANEEGGGRDGAFRHHALFQPGRTSPLVARLKAEE